MLARGDARNREGGCRSDERPAPHALHAVEQGVECLFDAHNSILVLVELN